jgi:L-erythro-3,5-diaminohexanoate dehydrogenase
MQRENPTAGDELGTHRVLEPPGALPQPAWKLDNDFEKTFETEIVVDVDILNIDAASFRQMEEAKGGAEHVPTAVLETIAARGKQHNPVTGSGGMLLGRVSRVGDLAKHRGVVVGDRVATLASLSLTPLSVEKITGVRAVSAQLDVVGKAAIFGSAPFAKMPTDFSERVALALLDVAGAAPQVARIAKPGQTILVLGAGGKSGVLCCAEARRRVGPTGKVIGAESFAPFAAELRDLGVCDSVIDVDARDPLAVRAGLHAAIGKEADATFSCVNVDGVEMSAIVSTRQRGVVYFFAMTTSFTRAALGAEGVGKDVDLFIGNGYAENHADHTLDLVRESPKLRALMTKRYGLLGRRLAQLDSRARRDLRVERGREQHAEGGALSFLRGHLDRPARVLHDALRDREAETRP